MQYDLDEAYQQSLPDFIQVLPEGFRIGGNPQTTLNVSIQDEQLVRTLWDQGRSVCRSIDGYSSISTKKLCRVCRDQGRCTVQIVLFVLIDDNPFRLALNYTSGQNYLAYRRTCRDKGHDLRHALTKLSVSSRGTWGEIRFKEVF